MRGEVVVANSETMEAVISLEEIVQFIPEECGVKEEELQIVFNNRNIIDWLNDKEGTSWEMRNVRNMTLNVGHLTLNIGVRYCLGAGNEEVQEYYVKQGTLVGGGVLNGDIEGDCSKPTTTMNLFPLMGQVSQMI
ncbi:hypothetical protein PIB30_033608 [Stylosanthes scabra]|uniref:Uncharacterized protein n=1 Tax=Stylosanthes scabra TaxID=79078 RepID=A0ABU6ZC78_9FABA|nr:hypothetical protein [Stylosanthes scabra]